MAHSPTYPIFWRMLITVIILISLTISHSISVNEGVRVSQVQQRKKVLGSRPPGCLHKCLNCSPCQATLVIPPHHKLIDFRDQSSHGDDDCYYLLSWKCKCGDRLFQP